MSLTITVQAQSEIDSLKDLVEFSDDERQQAEVARKLFLHYRLTDLDSAFYYAEISQDFANIIGDSLLISRSEFSLGWVYNQRGFYENAIDHYTKALRIAVNNDFVDQEKYILNNLGLASYYYGNYAEALEYHFQSLRLREQEGNQIEVAISCNNIGLVYYKIKDFRKAIEYFTRALKIKKGLGDLNRIETTLINLGLCYSDLKNYEQALTYFNEVQEICKSGCEKDVQMGSYQAAGLAYFNIKNFKEAEKEFLNSNLMANELNSKSYLVINLHYLAKIALGNNDARQAFDYLNESQKIANEISYIVWIKENYQIYGGIYAIREDYKQAYTYQKKYDSLNRIIVNEEVIQNLAKVQINYQERENLQTINLQKSEISRRTTLLLLSAIIILLAVIILVILYKNNQQRRKVNSKLTTANGIIEEQNHELTNINSRLEEKVRERTKELKTSNAALVKSNTELDNFIYKTSHDIRGPLATLQGVCNVAMIDIEDEKAIDYFMKLGKTANRLNEILSKLLIINQINNSLTVSEPIDFDSLINSIVHTHRTVKKQKQISIDRRIDHNLNFKSDEGLMRIILNNLIGNAIKFHNASHRVESFVKICITGMNDHISIKIIDNGIGINENVSHKIFEIFSKASEMSDSAGLGLYLVKLAVEKLQGSIELNKTEDNFTLLSIQLPYDI